MARVFGAVAVAAAVAVAVMFFNTPAVQHWETRAANSLFTRIVPQYNK